MECHVHTTKNAILLSRPLRIRCLHFSDSSMTQLKSTRHKTVRLHSSSTVKPRKLCLKSRPSFNVTDEIDVTKSVDARSLTSSSMN